jgi:hypothetical protein
VNSSSSFGVANIAKEKIAAQENFVDLPVLYNISPAISVISQILKTTKIMSRKTQETTTHVENPTSALIQVIFEEQIWSRSDFS